jgi:hypothetical protein
VFDEIDAALRSLFSEALPAATAVDFGAPGRSQPEGPLLNAFLREIREDLDARAGGWIDQRDETGRVVGRFPTPRRYRLCYLVTAWTSEVDGEHALLGSALAALAAQDTMPLRHLRGTLADAGSPVTINVADPQLPVTPSDLWSALGTAPRTALDVVITAPLVRPAVTELTRAPEEVALGVASGPTVPAPERPQRIIPRRRITEHS